jgi:hypothetical protein
MREYIIMRAVYNSLSEFYWAYTDRSRADADSHRFSIAQLDELEDRIRSDFHATVFETKREKVVVQLRNEFSDSHLSQKMYAQKHYTKLSAAIPKDKAAAFSEACRLLGISQSAAILPAIEAVIKQASETKPSAPCRQTL